MVAQDRLQQFNEWMMAATRYVLLANAGGAIAILGFIGTTITKFGIIKLAVLPLAFFVIGIIVGSLAILGQLTAVWSAWVQEGTPAVDPTRSSPVTRLGAWAEPRTGRVLLIGFACFVVGSVIGVMVLLAA